MTKLIVLILIILAVPVGAYLLAPIWQGPGIILPTLKDSVRLCETENPHFAYNQACQQFIDKKYPNRFCAFTLNKIKTAPLGSCGNCDITCT